MSSPKNRWVSQASVDRIAEIDQLFVDVAELAAKCAPAPTNDEWIQTFTGRKFYPLAPRIEDICIEDIAHALALQCRFTGHVRVHYSIAQHSEIVSRLVPPELELQGLLHDASEAYLVDVPSPIKRSATFADYRRAEARLQRMIFERFGCPLIEHAFVKAADRIMLATEARDLMYPPHVDWPVGALPPPMSTPIRWITPQEAERRFLARFGELYQGK